MIHTSTTGLSSQYGEWLDTIDWTQFATFTARQTLTTKSARRAMNRVYSRLVKHTKDGLTIFWVAEPNQASDGCHLHALLKMKTDCNPIPLIKSAWFMVSKSYANHTPYYCTDDYKIAESQAHQFTVIEPYKKGLGANHYLTKSLINPLVDYDIILN